MRQPVSVQRITTNTENDTVTRCLLVPHAAHEFTKSVWDNIVYRGYRFSPHPDIVVVLATSHRNKTASWDSSNVIQVRRNGKQWKSIPMHLSESDDTLLLAEHSWQLALDGLGSSFECPCAVAIVGEDRSGNTFDKVCRFLHEFINPLIVVSSDLAHYGPRYSETRYGTTPEVRKKVEKNDMSILKEWAHDSAPQLKSTDNHPLTPCGIHAMNLWSRLRERMYGTSELDGNIVYSQSRSPLDTSFVGYGGMSLAEPQIAWVARIPRWTLKHGPKGDNRAKVVLDVLSARVPRFGLFAKHLPTNKGVFVTIRERKTHRLQGCIGTFVIAKAVRPLAHLIISYTFKALLEDNRFSDADVPLRVSWRDKSSNRVILEQLLANTEFECNLLGKESPLPWSEFNEKFNSCHLGVILRMGSRSATFLPSVAQESNWAHDCKLINPDAYFKALTQKMGSEYTSLGDIQKQGQIETYPSIEFRDL